ncbi:PAS domain S-box protein [Clostridiaceae bacterium M8S5]|nr:PAS domain S-box protein [Clostridiaceae bacterium M8S5]
MDTLLKLKELLKSDSVGVAILNIKNLNNCFYTMNDTLKEYFKYSEDEINRLTLADITHSDDLIKTLKSSQKILNKEIPRITYQKRYIRKDGTMFWGSTTLSRISDCFLLYIVKDITVLEEVEEEIKHLLAPLSDQDKNECCMKVKKQTIKKDASKKDRKYYRVALRQSICAKIHLQQNMKDSVMGFSPTNVCITNISAGGLCFISNERLPEYEEYEILFEFKLLGELLNLRGDIVRFGKVKGKYEYGVRFIIDENERDKLMKILNNVTVINRNLLDLYDTDLCTELCKKDN